jgi:integrase
MRSEDPDYVTKGKDGYEVQPPVVHPAYCVCRHCKAHRPADAWPQEVIIRTRRKSPYPTSRIKSAAYALTVKKQVEADLRAAVEAANARKEALATAVSVERVCTFYGEWQREHEKDWDRDKYRIRDIQSFLGGERDASTVTYDDYVAFCAYLAGKGRSKATQRRYTNVLLAMFNRAVKGRLIKSHHLVGIERPKVVTTKKPVILTKRQIAILLGSAMDRFEREQSAALQAFEREQQIRVLEGRPLLTRRPPSVVPLRGFVLIAYLTLMRPETNFELRWEQLKLHPTADRGRFRLGEHKNASKGVEVDAPLKPELVRYLRSIMPSPDPEGLVHPNPDTRAAYRNIGKQWLRLVEIANSILEPDEQLSGRRTQFYTFRHTGASHLAESSRDPVLVTRMMGDTQLVTVMRHYFDSDFEHMQDEVEKWHVPTERELAAANARRASTYESGIESGPN